MGLSRLYAETDLDNGASQAVLLRAGFRRWGQDRYAYRNGPATSPTGPTSSCWRPTNASDRRPRRVDEVTLDGERVRLRPWRADDASRVRRRLLRPAGAAWLSGLPDPYTLEHADAYIRFCRGQAALGAGLYLAMAEPDDDVCVGSVALMELGGLDPSDRPRWATGLIPRPAVRG